MRSPIFVRFKKLVQIYQMPQMKRKTNALRSSPNSSTFQASIQMYVKGLLCRDETIFFKRGKCSQAFSNLRKALRSFQVLGEDAGQVSG